MPIKEWVEQWASREIADLKRVPVTLVVVLGVGAIAGGWSAQQFYAERMEVLELLRNAQGVSLVPKSEPPQPAISVLPYGRRLDIATGTIWLGLLGVLWWKVRQVGRLRKSAEANDELLRTAAQSNAQLATEPDQARVALRD